jgi:hypothetical protein
MLVAAPSVTVKSDGFTPAGTEQGFNLYTRDNIPAGFPFDVSVSGTAPPPQASDNQGQGNDQDPSVNSRANETIQALPNRLDSLRWIIIGGFAALIVIGVLLLWRQPVLASAGGVEMSVSPNPAQGPRKRKAAPVPAKPAGPPARPDFVRAGMQGPAARPAAPLASATAVAEPVASPAMVSASTAANVDSEVQSGLDALKDKLFRLELRRQAGTISEEDYARERARTEAVLRELVRG